MIDSLVAEDLKLALAFSFTLLIFLLSCVNLMSISIGKLDSVSLRTILAFGYGPWQRTI